VIPIENSLAGSVAEHFDLLLARNVSIQQEYRLRIVHNLIAAPGCEDERHSASLLASGGARSVPGFFSRGSEDKTYAFYDTAGSVKHVIEDGLRDAAGIAGRQAASVYGGRVLEAGIEDDKQNFTRFFLDPQGTPCCSRRE